MVRSPARVAECSPRRCAWLLAMLFVPIVVQAQPPTPVHRPEPLPLPVPRTTGDATVDARLLDIDRYGARYRDAFVDELVRYHAAPRDLVRGLLERGWPPGDVYFACALAQATGRACRHVTDSVADGAPPDWMSISQRLGAAPGSPRFARVRDGVEATYRRWGRPLPRADARAGHGPAARMAPEARAPTATPARPPREPAASDD